MKVPADRIIIPLVPRRPRNGIRSYHTDHPVWSEPSPYDVKWPSYALDPNGQIHDLAGWAELGSSSNRWMMGGAALGFLLGKGLVGITLGALAGNFAGPLLGEMFTKLRKAGQIVEAIPGGK